jgi:lipoate---protein ligase
MLLISHNITQPYFNIASEEYLLRNFTDDVFMLYQNTPSVIVGKHQNTYAEINYWHTSANNIDVVRRLSGGGTVYHDLGNLNFTFIQNGLDGNLVDFKRFIEPILQVLQMLGVNATRSGRNDLIINNLKFSGNAEHVYKNRTLHHGTLLFSSQLQSLGKSLQVQSSQYTDKAVKSVRSKVTNIIDHLPTTITLEEFRQHILSHISKTIPKVESYIFSETDISNIIQLVAEKYETWEWNFAYSPKFTIAKTGMAQKNEINLTLDVEKGIIKQAHIKINQQQHRDIECALIGIHYREEDVAEIASIFFENQFVNKLLRVIF